MAGVVGPQIMHRIINVARTAGVAVGAVAAKTSRCGSYSEKEVTAV